MRITYKCDYALRAVLQLAVGYERGLVTIQDLADRTRAPKKFLEQVLLDLKRGGFVESRRGKIGGYLLLKSPADIRVGDVVQFIDGPVAPLPKLKKETAEGTDFAARLFQNIWNQAGQATLNVINNVTFEELAREIRLESEAVAYSI